MDVNIVQVGQNSKHLVEIRDQIAAGLQITHLLNVKVSNEPADRNVVLAIRRALKSSISAIPLPVIVKFGGESLPVTITWRMVGAGSTAYYVCQSPYNDNVMADHTRLAMNMISNSIRFAHPEFGSEWGIAYLITKPLGLLNQFAGGIVDVNFINDSQNIHVTDEEDDDIEEIEG